MDSVNLLICFEHRRLLKINWECRKNVFVNKQLFFLLKEI